MSIKALHQLVKEIPQHHRELSKVESGLGSLHTITVCVRVCVFVCVCVCVCVCVRACMCVCVVGV